MRNLKKFLALVLAMVMTFSLMLSVNAATTGTQYKDGNVDAAFEKAVDVLTGMGIFKGDDNANLNAKQNVTRAEMAAIIYRLATGDVEDKRVDLYKEYGNFVDVNSSDWFAGYAGYCANAEYIKGRPGNVFDGSANVTGYEALAMILRVVGYDKESEFTGATWQVNVSSLATRLGLVRTIKNANYDTNLQYPSTREVIASLVFEGIRPVKGNNQGGAVMVTWTPSLHYQTWNVSGDMADGFYSKGRSVGEYIFGLAMNDDGILLGNNQTGEGKDKSIMGYKGATEYLKVKAAGGAPAEYATVPFSAYTWKDTESDTTDVDGSRVYIGNNVKYELETGIELIGHNLELWYDNGTGAVSNSDKHVFAYFDKATLTDVVKIVPVVATNGAVTYPSEETDVHETADNYAGGGRNLFDLAKAAGFKVNDDTKAVFNNSFGYFGENGAGHKSASIPTGGNGKATNGTAAAGKVPGTKSPVHLYKLISNSGDKSLDAVILLNIETSRITESNVVRNVHTLGMPVGDDGTASTNNQLDTMYIDKGTAGQNNIKTVGSTKTGVIAKDAVVGNSTTALRDYEMGIHITGTTQRDISDNEKAAIVVAASQEPSETSRYLLHKVTATVEGKVVAYNANLGTVTLEDGTVLNRSKFYNTVVNTAQGKTRQAAVDANGLAGTDKYALPQSIDDSGKESYNFANYKFYTDYEGKYLGAERTYGNEFLYATYVDYTQDTSSSAFTFKVTGVDLEGNKKTIDVTRFWADDDATSASRTAYASATANTVWYEGGGYGADFYKWEKNNDSANRKCYPMTGTNNLGVPFRDTANSAGVMNFIGEGVYKGITVSDGVASPFTTSAKINNSDYGINMERLGIQSAYGSGKFTKAILIGKDQITLGVVETETKGIDTATAGSNLFFNEETKFILVDGYGTANLEVEVYDGISDLKGDANYVTIDFNSTRDAEDLANPANKVALVGADTNTKYWVKGGKADKVSATERIAQYADWNRMTYFTSSAFVYDQTGSTAKKINTIILPKDAVYWDNSTKTTYYMGNPTPLMVSSHEGTPIWQYIVYDKGVAKNVWLTNAPDDDLDDTTDAVTTVRTAPVINDAFLTLGDEVGKTEHGQPYYTATFEDVAVSGIFVNSTSKKESTRISGQVGKVDVSNPLTLGTQTAVLNYTATTREAQAGTFKLTAVHGDGGTLDQMLLKVSGANVTNLNAADSPMIGTASGYVWPDITDVATLNAAGSILPVTGVNVRVAIERDGLTVTQIYVCWNQNQP